jgi:CTP:molybdopterin cytidylyltransferase MocA
MIPGAILAAGVSRRMGQSKALLRASGDRTFVAHAAEVLRDGGVAGILVVGRPEDDALRAEAATLGPDVRYVENLRADEGQLTSVIAAVDLVDRPEVQGLLVVPVDQPLLTAATVSTVLQAFSRVRPPIARASVRGRHGHPVLFARTLFRELRQADPGVGARLVLRAHADAVLDVEVPDEGAILDVDDPDTYKRLFGRQP